MFFPYSGHTSGLIQNVSLSCLQSSFFSLTIHPFYSLCPALELILITFSPHLLHLLCSMYDSIPDIGLLMLFCATAICSTVRIHAPIHHDSAGVIIPSIFLHFKQRFIDKLLQSLYYYPNIYRSLKVFCSISLLRSLYSFTYVETRFSTEFNY